MTDIVERANARLMRGQAVKDMIIQQADTIAKLQAMTDELDKLAREIAEDVIRDEPENPGLVAIVRLAVSKGAKKGLEAGMKLQRERDAVIAESLYRQSALCGGCDTEIKSKAVQQAAQVIRSAL